MRSCSCCHLSWRFRSSSGSQDQRSPCLAWGNTGNDTCQTPPHIHTHTQILMDPITIKKTTTIYRQPHTVSSGIRKPPHYQHGPRHTYAKTSAPHSPQEKRKRRGKTEIVGLPQEHYSNSSQRLPTKERERQRKKQMRSKEKWKQFRPFMYSILIWHATRAVLRMLEYEAANSQKHKQLNAIVIFSDADENLRCRWSFPISF